jgi:hypothetical protein
VHAFGGSPVHELVNDHWHVGWHVFEIVPHLPHVSLAFVPGTHPPTTSFMHEPQSCQTGDPPSVVVRHTRLCVPQAPHDCD